MTISAEHESLKTVNIFLFRLQLFVIIVPYHVDVLLQQASVKYPSRYATKSTAVHREPSINENRECFIVRLERASEQIFCFGCKKIDMTSHKLCTRFSETTIAYG